MPNNDEIRIDSNGRRCGVDCACTIGECEFPIVYERASLDVNPDIKTLREALVETRAWIEHWTTDRQHKLIPTQTSLDAAHKTICKALAETEHAS